MNVLNKVTRKNLVKNRVRTMVTIIGVILSVAMITAVTTMISTLQNYLVKSTISEEGDWYVSVQGASEAFETELQQDSRVERIGEMAVLGYAKLESGQNKDKPYWYVTAWDDTMMKSVPVTLVSGRMPKNGQEILVPAHMAENGGVSHKIGDRVTLNLGTRQWSGEMLWQENGFYGQDMTSDPENPAQAQPEQLVTQTTRTFTVVGICERPNWLLEDYSAPGYTAITCRDRQDEPVAIDLYIRTRHASDAQDIINAFDENGSENDARSMIKHTNLLQMMGVFGNDNIMTTLGSMAVILLVIILIGSVSLIYNAFAISVSERSKQFGLLSSVGATRRQLRSSVFHEAAVISGIGIPLGLLAGIGGIGVTLYFIGDWFQGLFAKSEVPMQLSVSWWAVVAAAVLGLVTILLSAWIPAKRASRVTAIDAIRQSQDIHIKAKQVKTSRLTRKLFGFEGEMALKNLKRSRRRYRSTVLSLAVSVILFISASSFTLYAFGSSQRVMDMVNYDVLYYYQPNFQNDVSGDQTTNRLDVEQMNKVFQDLKQTKGVTDGTLTERVYLETVIAKDDAGEAYYQQKKRQQEELTESIQSPENEDDGDFNYYVNPDGTIPQMTIVYAMDEDSFARWTQEIGVSLSAGNGEGITAIAINASYEYNSETQRYETIPFFGNEGNRTLSLRNSNQKNGDVLPVNIAGYTTSLPVGMQYYETSGNLYLIVPATQMPALRQWAGTVSEEDNVWINSRVQMYFQADDSAAVTKAMKTLLEGKHLPSDGVYDAHENDAYEQRFASILQVFTYGFITLISLITVANVFNTISTNIHLRRREFAMLQSVGLSPKGFSRMMRFECLFYGLKALLYGLPISFVVMYALYRSVSQSMELGFLVPWSSVLISIGSVFLVVFITMLYATHKIRNENIIDSLKIETT